MGKLIVSENWKDLNPNLPKGRISEYCAHVERQRRRCETLLQASERVVLEKLFDELQGNVHALARVLGAKRTTIRGKLVRHGILPEKD